VKGLAETIAGLKRTRDAVPRAMHEALRRNGFKIVKSAVANAPVRTGNLKNSIGLLDQGPNQVAVVAMAPYSAFVEFGTRKMTGRAYLGKAVAEHAGELEDDFWQVLGEVAPT